MEPNIDLALKTEKQLEPLVQQLDKELQMHSGEPPDTLYHYTNAVGLLGITQSRHLWATRTDYLNDRQEIRHAAQLIEEELKLRLSSTRAEPVRRLLSEMATTFHYAVRGISAYVACFCVQGDLLSQWRGYGVGGAGFALGFDTTSMGRQWGPGHPQRNFILRKAIYDGAIQRTLISRRVEAFINAYCDWIKRFDEQSIQFILPTFGHKFRSVVLELMITFKDVAFEQEHEWRAIFLTDELHGDNTRFVKFRSSAEMLIPYVEIDLSTTDNKQDGVLPLSDVVIGPVGQPALSQESLALYLNHSYLPAKIRVSSVPLR